MGEGGLGGDEVLGREQGLVLGVREEEVGLVEEEGEGGFELGDGGVQGQGGGELGADLGEVQGDGLGLRVLLFD